jgi:hypothetical protein
VPIKQKLEPQIKQIEKHNIPIQKNKKNHFDGGLIDSSHDLNFNSNTTLFLRTTSVRPKTLEFLSNIHSVASPHSPKIKADILSDRLNIPASSQTDPQKFNKHTQLTPTLQIDDELKIPKNYSRASQYSPEESQHWVKKVATVVNLDDPELENLSKSRKVEKRIAEWIRNEVMLGLLAKTSVEKSEINEISEEKNLYFKNILSKKVDPTNESVDPVDPVDARNPVNSEMVDNLEPIKLDDHYSEDFNESNHDESSNILSEANKNIEPVEDYIIDDLILWSGDLMSVMKDDKSNTGEKPNVAVEIVPVVLSVDDYLSEEPAISSLDIISIMKDDHESSDAVLPDHVQTNISSVNDAHNVELSPKNCNINVPSAIVMDMVGGSESCIDSGGFGVYSPRQSFELDIESTVTEKLLDPSLVVEKVIEHVKVSVSTNTEYISDIIVTSPIILHSGPLSIKDPAIVELISDIVVTSPIILDSSSLPIIDPAAVELLIEPLGNHSSVIVDSEFATSSVSYTTPGNTSSSNATGNSAVS